MYFQTLCVVLLQKTHLSAYNSHSVSCCQAGKPFASLPFPTQPCPMEGSGLHPPVLLCSLWMLPERTQQFGQWKAQTEESLEFAFSHASAWVTTKIPWLLLWRPLVSSLSHRLPHSRLRNITPSSWLFRLKGKGSLFYSMSCSLKVPIPWHQSFHDSLWTFSMVFPLECIVDFWSVQNLLDWTIVCLMSCYINEEH